MRDIQIYVVLSDGSLPRDTKLGAIGRLIKYRMAGLDPSRDNYLANDRQCQDNQSDRKGPVDVYHMSSFDLSISMRKSHGGVLQFTKRHRC